MKNDATFVRIAQWYDHLGDRSTNSLEKGHLTRPSNLDFFNNCDSQKRSFPQTERRRADLQNVASDFLIFAWGLSYDLSKFKLDGFTPFFQTLKDNN